MEEFEVFALHVFHGQIAVAVDLAMAEIADDIFMVVNVRQDFAAAQETAFGGQAEPQVVVQQAERAGPALGVGRQPDIGHAAAVDQLLQIIRAELAGLAPFGLARF